jgi:hypothetical protein
MEGAELLGPQLAAVGADSYLLNQAVEVLQAYSLLHRGTDKNTNTLLSVHRLVQAVLKDQMSEQDCRQWAERAVWAVSTTFPNVEFTTWLRCEQLLPHALACCW